MKRSSGNTVGIVMCFVFGFVLLRAHHARAEAHQLFGNMTY